MLRIEKLEDALEHMSDKALIRFMKRCACQTLSGLGAGVNEARAALDMVYLECSRRGKERLYDTVYATVAGRHGH